MSIKFLVGVFICISFLSLVSAYNIQDILEKAERGEYSSVYFNGDLSEHGSISTFLEFFGLNLNLESSYNKLFILTPDYLSADVPPFDMSYSSVFVLEDKLYIYGINSVELELMIERLLDFNNNPLETNEFVYLEGEFYYIQVPLCLDFQDKSIYEFDSNGEYEDACVLENVLNELVCDDGYLNYKTYICEEGCYNGVCLGEGDLSVGVGLGEVVETENENVSLMGILSSIKSWISGGEVSLSSIISSIKSWISG